MSKLKITQLYEVIRNRRSEEKPKNLKRKLLSMPRGVKRQRMVAIKSISSCGPTLPCVLGLPGSRMHQVSLCYFDEVTFF